MPGWCAIGLVDYGLSAEAGTLLLRFVYRAPSGGRKLCVLHSNREMAFLLDQTAGLCPANDAYGSWVQDVVGIAIASCCPDLFNLRIGFSYD